MMLEGKTAVVTGANRGLGRAILETFAQNGCRIFACARTLDNAFLGGVAELGARHRVEISPVALDLLNESSVKDAARAIVQQAERIDVLVNNAGQAAGGLFQMANLADMRKLYEVNLFAQLLFMQGIARKMIRQKAGSIINISSTAVDFADPGTMAYGSSKAAFARAGQSLATELGAFQIRVNAIAPGLTKTDMYEQMAPEARSRLVDRSALKRAATPQEVANAALFLASDLSTFITGQVIRVDGGMV
jgi:3-oxoacyl-[acyl-carrier protein] reductase